MTHPIFTMANRKMHRDSATVQDNPVDSQDMSRHEQNERPVDPEYEAAIKFLREQDPEGFRDPRNHFVPIPGAYVIGVGYFNDQPKESVDEIEVQEWNEAIRQVVAEQFARIDTDHDDRS
ncbi:MAG: hypothetical protein JWM81_70 [Candidatus Saccharibacteria bacterium]|nr:hypothetical protein [Candidatus Saccharibacteria bacterium]